MGYQSQIVVHLAVTLVRQQPWLSAEAVSERLGVHRHTLQRALKAHGQNFASIKKAIVLKHLERRLADSKSISLKQIWTELGFASASSFARYVRRTTGKSPTEFIGECALGQSVLTWSEMSLDRHKAGE